MRKIGDFFLRLYIRIKDHQRGATAVEYGIMVALIAAVIIGVVVTLGQQVQGAFQTVSDELPAP